MGNKPMKKKDLATAIISNFLLPGAGYIYVGRYIIGTIVLLIAAACTFAMVGGSPRAGSVLGFLSVMGAIDGYLTVRKYNSKVEDSENASLIACPSCAEKIQSAAKVCRFCQTEIKAERKIA